MKQIAAVTLVAFMALTPAYADNHDQGEMGEGLNLMEEGAKILLRGLMTEMNPALEDLQELFEEMGPGLIELRGMIDDFSNYHAPEILPNGDIIIRRKSPIEADPLEEGEIEL